MWGHDNDFLVKAYEGNIYYNEIEHIVELVLVMSKCVLCYVRIDAHNETIK